MPKIMKKPAAKKQKAMKKPAAKKQKAMKKPASDSESGPEPLPEPVPKPNPYHLVCHGCHKESHDEIDVREFADKHWCLDCYVLVEGL
jgi:hypothetical protein